MPGVRAVAPSAALPAYDAWIDQASLPRAFGTTLETIPAAEGFLQAEPGRVAGLEDAVAARPNNRGRFRGQSEALRRPTPFGAAELIDRLLDIRGVSLVNLQYGQAARRLGLRGFDALADGLPGDRGADRSTGSGRHG